jgi:hypothetical protein
MSYILGPVLVDRYAPKSLPIWYSGLTRFGQKRTITIEAVM